MLRGAERKKSGRRNGPNFVSLFMKSNLCGKLNTKSIVILSYFHSSV